MLVQLNHMQLNPPMLVSFQTWSVDMLLLYVRTPKHAAASRIADLPPPRWKNGCFMAILRNTKVNNFKAYCSLK